MTRYPFPMAFSPMIVLISLAPPGITAEPPVEDEVKATLTEVAAAWKRREERIHSGEFEWKEVRVMARGPTDFSRGPFGAPAGQEPKGTVTDRKTHRHEYEREFVFEGDKLRYCTNEPAWALGEERYMPFGITSATDGRMYRLLEERRLPGRFRHQGVILPDAEEGIRCMMAVKPFLLHFQPSRYDAGFLARFTSVNPHGVVDGKRCLILERVQDSPGPLVESVWLDPEAEFSIRRLVGESGSVTTTRWDVFYEADPEHGPIPRGWKLVEHFPNGEFDRSCEATVVTGKVNHEIPDARFVVEFPIDTPVRDASGPPGQEPLEYIVRAGGERRIVLREELRRAKTAEELIRTETGLAGIEQPQGSWWPGILWAGMLTSFAGLAAFGIYRLRRA